jgi:sensor histidine kinase YesM
VTNRVYDLRLPKSKTDKYTESDRHNELKSALYNILDELRYSNQEKKELERKKRKMEAILIKDD